MFRLRTQATDTMPGFVVLAGYDALVYFSSMYQLRLLDCYCAVRLHEEWKKITKVLANPIWLRCGCPKIINGGNLLKLSINNAANYNCHEPLFIGTVTDQIVVLSEFDSCESSVAPLAQPIAASHVHCVGDLWRFFAFYEKRKLHTYLIWSLHDKLDDVLLCAPL